MESKASSSQTRAPSDTLSGCSPSWDHWASFYFFSSITFYFQYHHVTQLDEETRSEIDFQLHCATWTQPGWLLSRSVMCNTLEGFGAFLRTPSLLTAPAKQTTRKCSNSTSQNWSATCAVLTGRRCMIEPLNASGAWWNLVVFRGCTAPLKTLNLCVIPGSCLWTLIHSAPCSCGPVLSARGV